MLSKEICQRRAKRIFAEEELSFRLLGYICFAAAESFSISCQGQVDEKSDQM